MSSGNYRIGNQHSVYFITFTVTNWVDVFIRLNFKNIIAESLEYCIKNKGLKLFAWCLMTNHIHMICTTEPPFEMSCKRGTENNDMPTLQRRKRRS